MKSKKVLFLKKIRVSEGIILKFVLSEEWDLILKHRASEIRVKRIRVNQGLGVFYNKNLKNLNFEKNFSFCPFFALNNVNRFWF